MPPHANEDVQRTGMLGALVMIARRWWWDMLLLCRFQIHGARLYADFGHDVRVRHLQRRRRGLATFRSYASKGG